MIIYNSGSAQSNKYSRPVFERGISKKVVDKTTSSRKKPELSRRNLLFLQKLGLKIKS